MALTRKNSFVIVNENLKYLFDKTNFKLNQIILSNKSEDK